MPELIEVEAYRLLAEKALHRVIAEVRAPDAWYLKDGLDRQGLEVLVGRRLEAALRVGKQLLLQVSAGAAGPGPVLVLRFGMSGRLLVDGVAGTGPLLYGAVRPVPAYERFGLRFADGGDLAVSDPRRLGGARLGSAADGLGPDAATLTLRQLRAALAGSRVPLKARLMDQSRVAGIGNLIGDEVLWRASLAPGRASASVTQQELARLHHHLRRAIAELTRRGGSHTGDLMRERRPGGLCPRDGAALTRCTVGGRTTWWCSRHQR